MTNLFKPVLDMSITGSVVILALLLVRFILKGCPKIYSYLLWSIAAFRLICPITLSSYISIFNFIKQVDGSAVSVTAATVTSQTVAVRDPYAIPSVIWIVGMVLLLVYSIATYYRFKLRLKSAVKLYDNVYCAEGIPSPFVLGVTAPRIYIPFGLKEEQQDYILKHENTHIKRKDHIIKLFAFGG